jgi:hypothetical protein
MILSMSGAQLEGWANRRPDRWLLPMDPRENEKEKYARENNEDEKSTSLSGEKYQLKQEICTSKLRYPYYDVCLLEIPHISQLMLIVYQRSALLYLVITDGG